MKFALTLVILAASVAGALPTLQVAPLQGAAPVIDGVLDDSAWNGATAGEVRVSGVGIPLEARTRFRVVLDTTNLYLAIECFENSESLKRLRTKGIPGKADALSADDCVEIFLDPSNARRDYYQLLVNAKGVHAAAYYPRPGLPEKGWQPSAYAVATSIGPESWTAELALPFRMFNRTEKSQAEWAFNLSRHRAAANETAYWAPVHAFTSHRPKYFGTLQGMPATTLCPDMALPQLEVRAIAGAGPVIDGGLQDDAWKNAVVSTAFRLKNGDTPQSKTTCRVIRDSNTVYVAVQCRASAQALQALKTNAVPQDPESMWGDDCVELFVDPTNGRKSYYQVSANASGLSFCRHFPKSQLADGLWQAPPHQVAVKIGKEDWTAEFALPLGLFTCTEKSATNWAFNVSRYESATGELSYWSPVYAGFSARPERFSVLAGMPEMALGQSRAGLAEAPRKPLPTQDPTPQRSTLNVQHPTPNATSREPLSAADRTRQARELLADSGVTGGLCAHIGCDDGTVLATLVQTGAFIGYGLSETPEQARAVTEELTKGGVHGTAFCESGSLAKLPLADNLVDLLIVDDFTPALQQELSFAEVQRVLCPYGVAYIGQPAGGGNAQQLKDAVAAWGVTNGTLVQAEGTWVKMVKPYPGGMDEWTHLRHGPGNNPVSHDTALQVPNRLRWIAGPSCTGAVPSPWDCLAGGASRMVSTHGRNIYLIPTGEDGKPPTMALAARDAFNGLLLWARQLPKASARPAWLVAAADNLYTEIDDETVKVDARTGKTLASFGPGEKHRQTLFCDNVLMLAAQDEIRAFDGTTDKCLWSLPVKCRKAVAEAGRLFCLDSDKELAAINLTNGVALWKKPVREWIDRPEELLFASGGEIVFESNTKTGTAVHAFSAADGTHLWMHQNHAQVFNTFSQYGDDVFSVRDSIWKLTTVRGGVPDEQGGATSELEQLDARTGVVRTRASTSATLVWRCYPLPATDLYLIGNRPPSFMSWETKITEPFRGTRGGCGSGLIIANGLLYTSYLGGCHCVQDAINGFAAFASEASAEPEAPAFPLEWQAEPVSGQQEGPAVAEAEWPMFRHDAARSSATTDAVPDTVKVLWETPIVTLPPADGPTPPVVRADWRMKQFASDPLTGPTLANGRLFVSLTDAAEVVALDRSTGKALWRRAVGGRLDTPPTCYRNLCLVGAHDGWVYALRAEDGQIVWRLRAAPQERRITAFGQVESPWPVVGGVLIQGDTAYCLAGRDTEVDGGLSLHAFRPATGEILWTEKVGRWVAGRPAFAGPANVLSCDGMALFIGGEPVGAIGLQTHGQFKASATFGVTAFASAHLRKHCHTLDCPSAFNDRVLCVRSGEETELLAYDQRDDDERDSDGKGPLVWKCPVPKGWSAETLVNAGDQVIVGYSKVDGGGAIQIRSLNNPAPAMEMPLADAPVREGLAVAGGCIYVSTRGGKVLCLASRR